MLGIIPKNMDVFPKYLGGPHSHLRSQEMLFKPRVIDEDCVQRHYLDIIDKQKGQLGGSK